MPKINNDQSNSLIPLDNTVDELFELDAERVEPHTMGFVPSFFTTASLPFKNVHKTIFVRKGSNGITLTLTSPKNVPFGRYGRLLLSVLTTRAVQSKEKKTRVCIEYSTLAELLKEMQLPKQRGKDIREQLECFSSAAFTFEQKKESVQAASFFKDMYEDGNYPTGNVKVTTHSTGNIRFTEGIQFQEINDGTEGSKYGHFKIILSAEFAGFCQKHAVPIDYNVYKEIPSASGKDLYAWLVFRNNGMKDSVFVPRSKLVEQFMPVNEGKKEQENVYYYRLLEELKDIKKKYYPEVRFDINSDGSGITLYKSPTPVLKNDPRYALITTDI